MSAVTIKSNHPVRKQIAELPNYFDSLTGALSAVDDVCREYGFELDWSGYRVPSDNDDYQTLDFRAVDTECLVCDSCDKHIDVTEFNNKLVFATYRMPSGRWEVTVYVS